jgi:hypothetical protein
VYVKASRFSLAVVAACLGLAAAACGGGDAEGGTPAAAAPAPVLDALRLLPDEKPLRRQILFGDPAQLREIYGGTGNLGDAMTGLWLPDALAGAELPSWGRRYGFRLGSVDTFVAAGFHPRAVAVLAGSSPTRCGPRWARAGTSPATGCSCAERTARSTPSRRPGVSL